MANPVLERLRSALSADERMVLRRVASVMRIGDRPRQDLFVWVEVFCNNWDEGMRTAREAVCDVVGQVIPSATYSGIEDVDRSGGQLWRTGEAVGRHHLRLRPLGERANDNPRAWNP